MVPGTRASAGKHAERGRARPAASRHRDQPAARPQHPRCYRARQQAIAVAEKLNFTRAARRLGMAQPPLSAAVGKLERKLGVRLLDRTSRRVMLTPAGAMLPAEGRAVAFIPASVASRHAVPELAFVPVTDLSPSSGNGSLAGGLPVTRHRPLGARRRRGRRLLAPRA
jgi:hypothetical protein